jgi:hypothetical protein
MTDRPRDISDLYLAPVALEVDARINELAALSDDKLAVQVAVESDEPDWTVEMRKDALLRAVGHLIELHGWQLEWDPRGIRLSHSARSLVLGIPESFTRYIGATT